MQKDVSVVKKTQIVRYRVCALSRNKNKIKNYATDKVKNCDIVDDKQRRRFSKFKVCALSKS